MVTVIIVFFIIGMLCVNAYRILRARSHMLRSGNAGDTWFDRHIATMTVIRWAGYALMFISVIALLLIPAE